MKRIFYLTIAIFTTVTYVFGQNSFREKNLIYHKGKIDFIESYLNLCLMVDSKIDKAAYDIEINLLCKEIRNEIKGYKTPQELIKRLNNYLFRKEAFKYCPDGDRYLYGTESEKKELKKTGISEIKFVLMPVVLKKREGICSSLSMLYLTIAYKLKLPIFGVIIPKHMFVRYNDGKMKINIETTNGGEEINHDYYREKYIKFNVSDLYLKDLNYEQVIGLYSGCLGNALDDYKQSLDFHNLAVEINPKYADAYLGRGFTKDRYQDYQGAIDDFTKAIEINPIYAEAYYDRGITKGSLKDYPRAIDDFTKAIEINPKYTDAYLNRGKAKGIKKDYQGSIDDYTKALEINPKDASAYYNRGIGKIGLGQIESGCLDFGMAKELGFDADYWIKKYCKKNSSTSINLTLCINPR